MSLSVCMITLNEEEDLPLSLESVMFAKEVIVIDCGSKDRTVEVAKKHGAKVFKRRFDNFAAQKNFSISKANEDWVLILDADERVSDGLKDEIKAVVNSQADRIGYQIPFKHYFMGRWIKFGDQYPSYHLRLIRREKAFYKGTVHETFEVDSNKVGRLSSPIIHFSYQDFHELSSKIRSYSQSESRVVRRTVPDLIVRPIWYFIKNYFLKRGFLDGIPGLIWHSYFSYYEFLVARKAVFK